MWLDSTTDWRDDDEEWAAAEEREREHEEADKARERRRMAEFDALLDAHEAEVYGPIYFIPAEAFDA